MYVVIFIFIFLFLLLLLILLFLIFAVSVVIQWGLTGYRLLCRCDHFHHLLLLLGRADLHYGGHYITTPRRDDKCVPLRARPERERTHSCPLVGRGVTGRAAQAHPSCTHKSRVRLGQRKGKRERGEGKRSEPGAMAGGGTVAAAETNEEKEVERTIPG
jgi:hypothetical protein